MDELEIARSTVQVLDRLRNGAETANTSNRYFPYSNHRRRTSRRFNTEELQLARLRARTVELAKSRSGATQDYESVLRETELEISVQLARLLAGSVDPVFEGLTKVVMEKSGDVCGVCQEEMNVGDEGMAMGCSHKFHPCCIVKWVKQKSSCPLCRYQIPINNGNGRVEI